MELNYMSHKVENTLYIPVLLHTPAQQPRALQSLSCLTLGTLLASWHYQRALDRLSPAQEKIKIQNPKYASHCTCKVKSVNPLEIGDSLQGGKRGGALLCSQPRSPTTPCRNLEHRGG